MELADTFADQVLNQIAATENPDTDVETMTLVDLIHLVFLWKDEEMEGGGPTLRSYLEVRGFDTQVASLAENTARVLEIL